MSFISLPEDTFERWKQGLASDNEKTRNHAAVAMLNHVLQVVPSEMKKLGTGYYGMTGGVSVKYYAEIKDALYTAVQNGAVTHPAVFAWTLREQRRDAEFAKVASVVAKAFAEAMAIPDSAIVITDAPKASAPSGRTGPDV